MHCESTFSVRSSLRTRPSTMRLFVKSCSLATIRVSAWRLLTSGVPLNVLVYVYVACSMRVSLNESELYSLLMSRLQEELDNFNPDMSGDSPYAIQPLSREGHINLRQRGRGGAILLCLYLWVSFLGFHAFSFCLLGTYKFVWIV